MDERNPYDMARKMLFIEPEDPLPQELEDTISRVNGHIRRFHSDPNQRIKSCQIVAMLVTLYQMGKL